MAAIWVLVLPARLPNMWGKLLASQFPKPAELAKPLKLLITAWPFCLCQKPIVAKLPDPNGVDTMVMVSFDLLSSGVVGFVVSAPTVEVLVVVVPMAETAGWRTAVTVKVTTLPEPGTRVTVSL